VPVAPRLDESTKLAGDSEQGLFLRLYNLGYGCGMGKRAKRSTKLAGKRARDETGEDMRLLLNHLVTERRDLEVKLDRAIRQAHERGLTQAEIARSVGVTQAAISKRLRQP